MSSSIKHHSQTFHSHTLFFISSSIKPRRYESEAAELAGGGVATIPEHSDYFRSLVVYKAKGARQCKTVEAYGL
uniref:Uncharacterized protein n=1 Tax=Tanacetum cinerariifolium TaxID=118510 RepID=A0A6L2NKA2_TANCI|nr:hypothetical protein [Tanacetum cinerariifolium]